jgi:hypothetical protein
MCGEFDWWKGDENGNWVSQNENAMELYGAGNDAEPGALRASRT